MAQKRSISRATTSRAPKGNGAVAFASPARPFVNGGSEFVHVAALSDTGKSLRDTVPRTAHAAWKKPRDHRDPVAILRAGDKGRLTDLIPIRYGRMLQSPFAYYRGSAAVMAADLAHTPVTGINVQACGDCHLMNFGGFASPERNILFDINDFDETLPGPWEWDVKRLVASFVLAARSNGLTDLQGREVAMSAARSYRRSVREYAEMSPLETWYSRITVEDVVQTVPKSRQQDVRDRLAKAIKRRNSAADFPRLAGMVGGKVSIRDAPPLIFHPEIARAPEFLQLLGNVFARYRETLSEDRRILLDGYRVVDAAIKVVGIGSVGRRCWIALLMSATNDPLFLQFKEAVSSVFEPYTAKSVYPHHGQRVVMGQRLMQPASDIFLGWVTGNDATGQPRQFYIRQLRDAKITPAVENYDAQYLSLYARACGRVLARAHARAGVQHTLSGYLGNSEEFDEAMGTFALAYADQAERDHAALKAAVKKGTVAAYRE